MAGLVNELAGRRQVEAKEALHRLIDQRRRPFLGLGRGGIRLPGLFKQSNFSAKFVTLGLGLNGRGREKTDEAKHHSHLRNPFGSWRTVVTIIRFILVAGTGRNV